MLRLSIGREKIYEQKFFCLLYYEYSAICVWISILVIVISYSRKKNDCIKFFFLSFHTHADLRLSHELYIFLYSHIVGMKKFTYTQSVIFSLFYFARSLLYIHVRFFHLADEDDCYYYSLKNCGLSSLLCMSLNKLDMLKFHLSYAIAEILDKTYQWIELPAKNNIIFLILFCLYAADQAFQFNNKVILTKTSMIFLLFFYFLVLPQKYIKLEIFLFIFLLFLLLHCRHFFIFRSYVWFAIKHEDVITTLYSIIIFISSHFHMYIYTLWYFSFCTSYSLAFKHVTFSRTEITFAFFFFYLFE